MIAVGHGVLTWLGNGAWLSNKKRLEVVAQKVAFHDICQHWRVVAIERSPVHLVHRPTSIVQSSLR